MAAKNGPNVAFYIYIVFITSVQVTYGAQYLGKFLGKLTEYHHGVSGEVYAVDSRTLHLKNFHYDGQGPAAYFYAGNSRIPSNSGFRIRDEDGKPDVIHRYRGESVTLTLPEGKTLANIKWFSIWCEDFAVNFGDVKIPRNFDYPRPQKIEGLKGVHGVSSDNIVIVDAQTLLIPNFSYDGEAPDAKFWVGRGTKPSPQGIRVPDENGKEIPLRRYDRKTVVLTLPGELTVFDIGHFGIWCEAFTVDFGHIQIPQTLNVPPSLRMLGVSPQKRPSTFDYPSEGSRPQVQLVGGHVEATTFRPSHFFRQIAPSNPFILQRRADTLPINTESNQQQLPNYQTNLVSPTQQVPSHQQNTEIPQTQQIPQIHQQLPFQQTQYQNQFTPQAHQQQILLYQQQLLRQQQILYQQRLLQQQLYQQQLANRAQSRIDIQPQNIQQISQFHFPQQSNNEQNKFEQRHLQEQQHYQQLLQQRRLQEEAQIREQLNRQYNRFQFPQNYQHTG